MSSPDISHRTDQVPEVFSEQPKVINLREMVEIHEALMAALSLSGDEIEQINLAQDHLQLGPDIFDPGYGPDSRRGSGIKKKLQSIG